MNSDDELSVSENVPSLPLRGEALAEYNRQKALKRRHLMQKNERLREIAAAREARDLRMREQALMEAISRDTQHSDKRRRLEESSEEDYHDIEAELEAERERANSRREYLSLVQNDIRELNREARRENEQIQRNLARFDPNVFVRRDAIEDSPHSQPAHEDIQVLGDQLLRNERLGDAQLAVNIDYLSEKPASVPNTLPVKTFLRVARLITQQPLLAPLYSFLKLTGEQEPSHRIYFLGKKTIECVTDVNNRAAFYSLLDSLNASMDGKFFRENMVQQLFMRDKQIMPFFDLEPDNVKFRAAIKSSRRLEDSVFLESVDADNAFVTPEIVVRILAKVFHYWSGTFAWIVHQREDTENNYRFHVHVRDELGDCVIIDRATFRTRLEKADFSYERMISDRGDPLEIRRWLGLDMGPYAGQMRMSNSAKNLQCYTYDELRANPQLRNDFKLYKPFGVYYTRGGEIVRLEQNHEIRLPYGIGSSRACALLPWSSGKSIIHQRNVNQNEFDIISKWLKVAQRHQSLNLPLHDNLKSDLFSFNWRPKVTLNHRLRNCRDKEEWEAIAKAYIVRVRDVIYVLDPLNELRKIRDPTTEEETYMVTDEYALRMMNFDKFKKEYNTFGGRKAGEGFADEVLQCHWCDRDQEAFTNFPVRNAKSFFNKWSGPGITPNSAIDWVRDNKADAKRAVRMFLYHISNLAGGQNHLDEKVRRYSMWYCSFLLHFVWVLVNRPFDRAIWQFIVAVQGPPGCGKGTLFKILMLLVGLGSTERIDGSVRGEKSSTGFNQFMHNLLVLIDEVQRLTPTFLAQLKIFCSEEHGTLEKKNIEARRVSLITHLVIFFNELDQAAKIDIGERRFAFSQAVQPPNSKFWDKYHELLFERGGMNAIALYCFTLKKNDSFFSDLKEAKVGPLKREMFRQSRAIFGILASNAIHQGWFGMNGAVFPFIYSAQLVEDCRISSEAARICWYGFFDKVADLQQINIAVTNFSDGFTETWPPFIPLDSLERLYNNGHLLSKEEKAPFENELLSVMHHTWPNYVQKTWPEHPVYKMFNGRAIIDVGELRNVLQDVRTVTISTPIPGAAVEEGKPPPVSTRIWHRACHAAPHPIVQNQDKRNCPGCGLQSVVSEIKGWVPFGEKTQFSNIRGKVLLLPKKADAEEFYKQMFPDISDIAHVAFPINWDPDRFDILVDTLDENYSPEFLAPQPSDDDIYASIGKFVL